MRCTSLNGSREMTKLNIYYNILLTFGELISQTKCSYF